MKYKKTQINYEGVLIVFSALISIAGLLLLTSYNGFVTKNGSSPISMQTTVINETTPQWNATENITLQETIPPVVTENLTKNITINTPTNIQSVCVVPYENMLISTNTTLCSGTYYLNDTDGNGAILIGADNIVLDCNGSNIIGNYTSQSIGLVMDKYPTNTTTYSNVVIANCKFADYYTGLNLMRGTDIKLKNILINDTVIQGIYLGGCSNVEIDNLSSIDSENSHGIYIDTILYNYSYNIMVKNSKFYNNAKFGIHINNAQVGRSYNISIYNNQIFNNQRGIDDGACENCAYYNNTIYNNSNSAIAFIWNGLQSQISYSSYNNTIYNNIFYNNGYDYYISNNTYYNTIYNNIYQDNTLIYFQDGSNSKFVENDNEELKIKHFQGDESIIFNYSGIKNFIQTNMTFQISNLLSVFPYNDIKNISNGVLLASNVDNFSITLAPNQQIIVGNFTSNKTPPFSNSLPVISNLRLYSPDNLSSSPLNCSAIISDADNTTLNISVDWIDNGAFFTNTYNSDYPNNTSFSDVINATNSTYHCVIHVSDGINITSATSNSLFIVEPGYNYPPTLNSSISLGYQSVNCSATIEDSDLMNLSIDFYDNNILNITDYFFNVSSGTYQASINDNHTDNVWYCVMNVTDGNSIVISTTANVTIPDYTKPTVTLVSPANGSSLSSAAISYKVDDLYHNSLTAKLYINAVLNQTSTITNDTIYNISLTLSSGTYTWNITATDPDNNVNSAQSSFTIVSTNTPSSGGGGGGGGGGGPIIVPAPEVVNTSAPTSSAQGTQDNVISNTTNTTLESAGTSANLIQTPIIQEPKALSIATALLSANLDVYILAGIIFIVLVILITLKPKPEETIPGLSNYIQQALFAGYPYDAIRTALKGKYKQGEIDHHFHLARRQDLKPLIRVKEPVDKKYSKEQIAALKVYIEKQQAQGYKDTDIKQALLHYGHSKSAVEEAFN